MNRLFFVTVAVLFTMSASYGQEMTNSQMKATINDLERRVGILEKIILSEKPTSVGTAKPVGSVDLAQWRKLEIGMKDADVRALLGEPLHIEYEGHRYTWRYSTQRWHSAVRFSDDGVSSWTEPE